MFTTWPTAIPLILLGGLAAILPALVFRRALRHAREFRAGKIKPPIYWPVAAVYVIVISLGSGILTTFVVLAIVTATFAPTPPQIGLGFPEILYGPIAGLLVAVGGFFLLAWYLVVRPLKSYQEKD